MEGLSWVHPSNEAGGGGGTAKGTSPVRARPHHCRPRHGASPNPAARSRTRSLRNTPNNNTLSHTHTPTLSLSPPLTTPITLSLTTNYAFPASSLVAAACCCRLCLPACLGFARLPLSIIAALPSLPLLPGPDLTGRKRKSKWGLSTRDQHHGVQKCEGREAA